MDAIFRTARRADSAALAELIYVAARAHYATSGYDLSLGGSRDDQIVQIKNLTRTDARSWFHFSFFDVAEVKGRVVASVAGFERPATDPLVDRALLEIGFSQQEVDDLNQRIAPVYARFPAERPGYWTIEHVAVLSEFRRAGLAGSLVTRAMDRGRGLGFRRCLLDVFSDNVAARSLYESLGFQISEAFGEDVMPRLLDRPGMHRMTREL